ncbi:Quinate dehydrogenase [Hyphodiscus hymeniophilus]|uniref:Quinate dehydrogenase n=1 Tax=Hyphodiscus hymeniophilus TaxID=353542 RepID=A0A9P7AUW9_9HELO|nr:Quinate dehydrogenase [Hyphodiscus hymeniophilus]
MSQSQTTLATSKTANPHTSHEIDASLAPPPPDTTHLDRVLYLFGYPIAHSLSPLFHGTVFSNLRLNYTQYLYESRSLSSCLALTHDPKFLGASVTMPFKVAIIPRLDFMTPEAAAIGAVNTIWWKTDQDGRRALCGTNTDCIGIREAIVRNVNKDKVEAMKGNKGMVIGGGGTSRAAVYALKTFLGCAEVYLVNRDKSEVDAVMAECSKEDFGDGLIYVSTIEEAESLQAPAVVVSAIPDFPPKTEDEIRTRKVIEILLGKEEKGAILEMCYHPSPRTEIAALAMRSGWQVVPGTQAMIWQGFEQDRVWLNKEVNELPVEKVKAVIAAKLARSHL